MMKPPGSPQTSGPSSAKPWPGSWLPISERRINIHWGATVLSLMMAAADTNDTVELDQNEAMRFFFSFTQGQHVGQGSERPGRAR